MQDPKRVQYPPFVLRPGLAAGVLLAVLPLVMAACAPAATVAPTLAVAPSAVPSPSAAATTAPTAMAAASPPAGATAARSPKAYVGIFNDNVVAVLDTASQQVLSTIPVPAGPHGLVMTPDGRSVYVSSDGDSKVSLIDTTSDTVVKTIEVG